MVTIELFGVPKLRAGVGRVRLAATTVAEALTSLGQACPALMGSVILAEGLHPAYRLNLNGDCFINDPATPLNDGDALILLAADVGG
jgi:molybdopterin converting factor small subunit